MTQSLSLVVLSTGLDNFKEIRTALAAESRVHLLAGGDDVEQLQGEIVRLKPAAAIITMGANSEQAVKLIQRLSIEAPKTAIIVAAYNPSPDLLLQGLRAGAREFLQLPISAQELTTVLDRVGEFCAGQVEAPKKKGRMVAVFSSKGGCGTSFIATNLAASTNARTVLVDLNLQAGDLPLFLGVDPKYSFADMAENRNRLDDALISSFVTPYSTNLSLLAAPREADSADEIEPEHVFEVLQRLRESYDYVVLDPQHTFDSITLAALDQSDEIVLILTLDIPAIRSTQRALEIFDRLGYPRKKIRIVVNRWSKQIDLDLRQVEKFLGEPVIGFVPSDYQTAVTSINLGRPLVQSEPNSKIALEIRRIGSTIATGAPPPMQEEMKPRRALWSSIFKREAPPKQFELQASLEKI
ncbi:MAG TPA: AAA family ATPase [Pyrinomonadaceae bacterium]|jgi:pilus assembly protein CpaE|nr:AAA family ATPase [Pyrinomonadaceae bacterium]